MAKMAEKHFFGVMDCNNFFVSCERNFNPKLLDKAVVVLSNNDGCAISRSQEAKCIGIKMGMPAFKIEQEFINKGIEVEFCSSNYTLYADMSRRVMNVLRSIVNKVEEYSIDECFIDFSGLTKTQIIEKGKEIVYKVRKYTGIPVSVGIAPTKTLAKVATHYAKKYKGYRGFCIIDSTEKREKALRLLDIKEVWGIGYRSVKFLKDEGICNALDFVNANEYWVKKRMGVNGLKCLMELRGESVISLEKVVDRQSITTSRSFGSLIEEKEQLQVAVSNFAASCAEKLRAQQSATYMAVVFLTTNSFREDLPQYTNSAVVEFEEATNDTISIVEESVRALNTIYKSGFKYKKAGVMLQRIIPQDQVQQNIFIKKNYSKEKRINELLDDVNRRFGRNKLHLAIQGSSVYNRASVKKGDNLERWEMKREHLSGNYTTNLEEVITIKAT